MHNSSNDPPDPSTEGPSTEGAAAEVPLPRPLLLHLTSLNFWCHSSKPASQLWRRDSLPWSPDLTAQAAELSREFSALAQQLGQEAAEGLFDHQLKLAAQQKLAEFAAGVSAYQNRRKSLPPRRMGRILAEFGAARLLDYGEAGGVAEGAPMVLLVPSLVNRATILDLSPERSLVDYLARSGLRPVVLDWGSPSAAENGFSLTDYICGYLAAGLELAMGQNGGRPVMLLGYCMGGLLALAAAQHYAERVSALILLATPWDFHSDSRLTGRLRANLPVLARLIDQQNGLSVDSLQSLFYGLDPFLVVRKYCQMGASLGGESGGDSGALADFTRLEDWLNDGVPLVRGVASETLLGWYGGNRTLRREWLVAGTAIDPSLVRQPALVVIPSRDRIVPPASALALAQSLPRAEVLSPEIGHVGMMASPRAEALVWQPLVKWLAGTV